MKLVASVTLLAASVLALACWPVSHDQAYGQVSPQVGKTANESLIALSIVVSERVQQVTVIDPRKRAMCVYHIDNTSGTVELKSARRIEWDLDMTQFNAVDPLPEEIRSFIEQNR